ncbi:MAG: methylamine dehydrogenase accessory protein MauD [Gemmatimonadota bacterium]
MTEALVISNVLLWLVVLALLVAVIALARQVGILYERVAPMGALTLDAGPAVGASAPAMSLRALDGRAIELGTPTRGSTLLFFLSPTCPVCKKLLPILRSIRDAEGKWLDVVLASDGDIAEHQEFVARQGLSDFPYVLSRDLGMAFRVGKLPYAVLVDEQGQVRAKGLVNSREQIESLFNARDLGVGSVQELVRQRG